MTSHWFKYLPWIVIVLFIGWSIFFHYSSPESLIALVGVENSYVFLSLLAFLGGITTFGGVPYHLILMTLASGGLNPWLLGLAAASGVMLGDSTSYYIGYHGSTVVPRKLEKILQRVRSFGLQHPQLLPWLFFLYGSLVPFSNDFVGISMGLARYPFWRVMIPLGVGNVVFNISLAFLATYVDGLLQAGIP